MLAVASLSTFDKVDALLAESSSGRRKLEWPQEVVCLLEVRAHSEDLMDKILSADDAMGAQGSLNDRVVGESNASLVDLTEPTLVDELTHSLKVGVSVGDIGLNLLQHVHGGLVHADEDTSVDATEAEKLKDLLGLGGNAVKTADTDHKDDLCLGLNEETVLGLGGTTKADEVGLLQ